MATSIIYAYLENVQWIAVAGSIVLTGFMILLAVFRITNDIDKDDWQILMYWTAPLTIFFLFLTGLPDMDHIKDVNKRFIELSIEPKQTEISNETVLYPSSECNSVRLCR